MHRQIVTPAIAIVVAIGTLSAAPSRLPTMPWGDPSFEGVWNYATMTPLERPRDFADTAVLTEQQAAAYEAQTIERQSVTNNTAGPDWWDPGTRRLVDRRSSLIVDPANGRLPALTAEAQQRAAARAQAHPRNALPDGPEDLGLNVRCLQWAIAGPPLTPGVYNNNVQFVQTRDTIAIVSEMIHDARLVPMDGRPHGTLRRWMGDPRGHWEGRTLVVDTINLLEKNEFRGSAEHLHLVERFTRTDNDTIDYRFTAEDPTTWTAAWAAEFPLKKINEPIYEYACHEGNARSVEGILRGAAVQR
jgi:hypothetical protein